MADTVVCGYELPHLSSARAARIVRAARDGEVQDVAEELRGELFIEQRLRQAARDIIVGLQ